MTEEPASAGSSSSPAARHAGGVFYGWVVVAAAFAVMFLSFGSAYTFSTFFEALQTEFGATRGSISLVFSIAGFLYFGLGAVSGPIADRFGPQRVVLFGLVVVAAGFGLASVAGELWQVYLAYGLGVGIGVGCAYVPSVGAVQPWFRRRRGLASGLAVTGIGAGTLCAPPLAAWLIEAGGWRYAYLIIAIVVGVLGIVAGLLIDHRPERRGLRPDGDAAPSAPAVDGSAASSAGLSLTEAFRTAIFWRFYIALVAASLGVFVPFVHIVPFATDAGLDSEAAVVVLSLIGLGSTVGRFAFAGLADRFGRRRMVAGLFFGQAVMLAWWIASTTFWQLAVFSFVFGSCYGGFVALMPAVTADYFGTRAVSGILGWLYSAVAFGTLLGPTLAGIAFDLWRSYSIPIAVAAATMALSALLVATMKDPRT